MGRGTRIVLVVTMTGGLLSLLQPYINATTAQPYEPSFQINDPSLDPTSSPDPKMGAGDKDASHWEDVARRMAMRKYGYSSGDFEKLDSIINRESSWDPQAKNPDGGAYGIPQILPSAHPGLHLQNDPKGQIRWLLQYIQGRYHGIDQALAFKNANGWY